MGEYVVDLAHQVAQIPSGVSKVRTIFAMGLQSTSKLNKASRFNKTIQRGTRCHPDQELIPNRSIDRNGTLGRLVKRK